MSDVLETAAKAGEHIEDLITDVLSGYEDSKAWLGTLNDGDTRIQVHLVVTRNEDDFMDEQ